MSDNRDPRNIDTATVRGFGEEWTAFDQMSLAEDEHRDWFDSYFRIFPFDELKPGAEGFDLGCGSGRWASEVAGRVGLLHCIDPAGSALAIARKRMASVANVRFHEAASDEIPLDDESQDFGYSLGVLHHIPDTRRALNDCVRKLRGGAPFLLYIYYSFDNRPRWYRTVWSASDFARRKISGLSFGKKRAITEAIAALVYWPLARGAGLAEKLGFNVFHWPLAPYRNGKFYWMRTDALDRFGTRLEQRFSRSEIAEMMTAAGLEDIRFSEREPFWVACGRKAR
ncbi:MAG: class I SAM-dependent methyltransferase [Sphingomicrobium sp.]